MTDEVLIVSWQFISLHRSKLESGSAIFTWTDVRLQQFLGYN